MKTQGVFMRINRTHNSDAFTLMEMIVVIVIMGLLMAIAVPVYNQYRKFAALSTTKSNLATLQEAIEGYKLTTQVYPSKLQDLIEPPAEPRAKKNWAGPYLRKIPDDSWGGEFHYAVTKGGKHDYELYSDGDPNNPSKIDVWEI